MDKVDLKKVRENEDKQRTDFVLLACICGAVAILAFFSLLVAFNLVESAKSRRDSFQDSYYQITTTNHVNYLVDNLIEYKKDGKVIGYLVSADPVRVVLFDNILQVQEFSNTTEDSNNG